MKNQTDPTTAARAFLELWQREITRSMSDPGTVASMLQAMQAFTQKANPHDARPRHAADASHAGHDAINELSRRIAKLERALAKLHEQLLSLDAKAKKPARAKRGRNAGRMAKPKRDVAKRPARAKAKKPIKKPTAKKRR